MKIRGKLFNLLVKLMIVLVILVVLGTLAFLGLQISGRSRLASKAGSRPDLTVMRGSGEDNADDPSGQEKPQNPAESQPLVDEEAWQEGDIRYQGKIYRYNEDILTFLFMGIDHEGEVEEAENGIDGGQSDAIFLLVLDTRAKAISLIGINRDTMTDIDVYTKSGSYLGTATGQLCLQHGYGDGMHVSCERSAAAVSRLFYGLPIHGYCAINMEGIPLLNDAVGGVEVTAPEAVKTRHLDLEEGEKKLLKGQEAYEYLRARDVKSFGSAGRRAERQGQYLRRYAAAAQAAMKEDITLPVTLYSTLSKYMVTDVAVDEVSYLATQAAGCTLEDEHIYSLQGETKMGEEFEEFYVDEKALYELILKVFYEEAGQAGETGHTEQSGEQSGERSGERSGE